MSKTTKTAKAATKPAETQKSEVTYEVKKVFRDAHLKPTVVKLRIEDGAETDLEVGDTVTVKKAQN